MIGPPLFTRIKNRNDVLSLRINASHKVVAPLIATTTGKCKIVELIRAAQGSGNEMIDGKATSAQALWGMTILAKILGAFSNGLLEFVTNGHFEQQALRLYG